MDFPDAGRLPMLLLVVVHPAEQRRRPGLLGIVAVEDDPGQCASQVVELTVSQCYGNLFTVEILVPKPSHAAVHRAASLRPLCPWEVGCARVSDSRCYQRSVCGP